MFPLAIASLTTFLLLIVSVATNPTVVRKSPVSLSLARRFDITGGHDLLKKDQGRAKNLVSIGKAKRLGRRPPGESISIGDDITITILGVSGAQVRIGINAPKEVSSQPATTNEAIYTALVDLTTPYTWVGFGPPYDLANTSVETGGSVSLLLGNTTIVGTEITDTVVIGDLVIAQQLVAVPSQLPDNYSFGGIGGIFGLGRTNATTGNLTVMGNLVGQEIIESDVFSISFGLNTSSASGELTFGSIDSTKYTGSITFTPIATTSSASECWVINQSVKYGSSTLLSTASTAIFDTTTQLILLASDAFAIYISAIGAIFDPSTGFYIITLAQYNSLQSLSFEIGGSTFQLTANAQIWPRSLNSQIGGTANGIYLAFQSLPTPSGQGPDCVMGLAFLKRFYTVYDATNNLVGIANTQFTTATTN